jgi:hypothetical protein
MLFGVDSWSVYGEHDNIEFEPFAKDGSASFWDHLSVHRLQVPRYANVSSCLDVVRLIMTDEISFITAVLHRDLAVFPLHLLSSCADAVG